MWISNIFFHLNIKAKFDINTRDASVQNACSKMMKNAVRQQRYRLKKKYFDPFPLHLVIKTSPVRLMTDHEWNELVEYWKTPKRMVWFFLKIDFLPHPWYLCLTFTL
jgi:hypothetical protein